MAVTPAADAKERSNPVNRMRWATQRVPGRKGTQKRLSILKRHLHRQQDSVEKRDSAAEHPPPTDAADDTAPPDEPIARTIYFNQPLPAHARDEQGHPLQHFRRNKIRTAKYTALTFIPMDLWWQFHNIANLYFLFVIILSVRLAHTCPNPPSPLPSAQC